VIEVGLPLWKRIRLRNKEDSGETNVKKEQNGKESLRRLKPIVGCNASNRRRRMRPGKESSRLLGM